MSHIGIFEKVMVTNLIKISKTNISAFVRHPTSINNQRQLSISKINPIRSFPIQSIFLQSTKASLSIHKILYSYPLQIEVKYFFSTHKIAFLFHKKVFFPQMFFLIQSAAHTCGNKFALKRIYFP